MSAFDSFVFVDWSANSTPKTGKDSIWIAQTSGGADISLSNPSTREAATRHVLGILRQAVERGQRVLVGFDFAYSYPLAVLRRLAGSHGPANFTDLWEAAHSRIQDSGDNSNDRYSFATWANEHWFREHYYWGFPSRSHAAPWLLGTRTDTTLPEFRLAESNSPGTQPTRKLLLIRLFQLAPICCGPPGGARPARCESVGRAYRHGRAASPQPSSERQPSVAAADCAETRTRRGKPAVAPC